MKKEVKTIKYRKPFLIFLILGILGLIDIASRKPMGTADEGIVGLIVGFPFIIFGQGAFATVWILTSLVLSFCIIYLILAFVFYRKMKKANKA